MPDTGKAAEFAGLFVQPHGAEIAAAGGEIQRIPAADQGGAHTAHALQVHPAQTVAGKPVPGEQGRRPAAVGVGAVDHRVLRHQRRGPVGAVGIVLLQGRPKGGLGLVFRRRVLILRRQAEKLGGGGVAGGAVHAAVPVNEGRGALASQGLADPQGCQIPGVKGLDPAIQQGDEDLALAVSQGRVAQDAVGSCHDALRLDGPSGTVDAVDGGAGSAHQIPIHHQKRGYAVPPVVVEAFGAFPAKGRFLRRPGRFGICHRQVIIAVAEVFPLGLILGQAALRRGAGDGQGVLRADGAIPALQTDAEGVFPLPDGVALRRRLAIDGDHRVVLVSRRRGGQHQGGADRRGGGVAVLTRLGNGDGLAILRFGGQGRQRHGPLHRDCIGRFPGIGCQRAGDLVGARPQVEPGADAGGHGHRFSPVDAGGDGDILRSRHSQGHAALFTGLVRHGVGGDLRGKCRGQALRLQLDSRFGARLRHDHLAGGHDDPGAILRIAYGRNLIGARRVKCHHRRAGILCNVAQTVLQLAGLIHRIGRKHVLAVVDRLRLGARIAVHIDEAPQVQRKGLARLRPHGIQRLAGTVGEPREVIAVGCVLIIEKLHHIAVGQGRRSCRIAHAVLIHRIGVVHGKAAVQLRFPVSEHGLGAAVGDGQIVLRPLRREILAVQLPVGRHQGVQDGDLPLRRRFKAIPAGRAIGNGQLLLPGQKVCALLGAEGHGHGTGSIRFLVVFSRSQGISRQQLDQQDQRQKPARQTFFHMYLLLSHSAAPLSHRLEVQKRPRQSSRTTAAVFPQRNQTHPLPQMCFSSHAK